MNKREVAKFIGKDAKTIYNWKKTNPNLYKILEFYFQKENEINPKHKELIE
ncbi:histidine kinase, partial [Campylobacter concisus]|nr:histidine kinase [Campylobacter concisus]